MKYGTWPAPRVAVPWLTDRRFLELHSMIHGKTLVTQDRCWMLYAIAKHVSSVPGAMVECGVYKGGTAFLLSAVAREQEKRLYLLDTFSGIPSGTKGVDTRYLEGGQFADTSREGVEAFVRGAGASVTTLQGVIPGTLQALSEEMLSLVHLDLDIYHPTLEALKLLYSRLHIGGVIVLDDYGFEECQGVAVAADQFGALLGAPPVVLSTGQALFIAR